MKMLNFGCGSRIADGWTNIDFSSGDPRVRGVNLLNGFPFSQNEFDAVYSSHVLEHFTLEQAKFLLCESFRVLKPNGTLRIVVPDFEAICKEYLKILSLPPTDSTKVKKYHWIMVELLDQLVRTEPGGRMGKFFRDLQLSDDMELKDYVKSRTENISAENSVSTNKSLTGKVRRLTLGKIRSRLLTLYLKNVSRLIPRNIRSMVFVEAGIGERHRWMYDRYGLTKLLEDVGFTCCQTLSHDKSSIKNFSSMLLDTNFDGSSYKNISIYMEAIKPV